MIAEQKNHCALQLSHFCFQGRHACCQIWVHYWASGVQIQPKLIARHVGFYQPGVLNISRSLLHICTNLSPYPSIGSISPPEHIESHQWEIVYPTGMTGSISNMSTCSLPPKNSLTKGSNNKLGGTQNSTFHSHESPANSTTSTSLVHKDLKQTPPTKQVCSTLDIPERWLSLGSNLNTKDKSSRNNPGAFFTLPRNDETGESEIWDTTRSAFNISSRLTFRQRATFIPLISSMTIAYSLLAPNNPSYPKSPHSSNSKTLHDKEDSGSKDSIS